jgi:hypothetical protein
MWNACSQYAGLVEGPSTPRQKQTSGSPGSRDRKHLSQSTRFVLPSFIFLLSSLRYAPIGDDVSRESNISCAKSLCPTVDEPHQAAGLTAAIPYENISKNGRSNRWLRSSPVTLTSQPAPCGRLYPLFSGLWNFLRHCNLLRDFVPLESLQKIEVPAGNMLHSLFVHCTKLLPDPFLEVAVEGRCLVTECTHVGTMFGIKHCSLPGSCSKK